MKKFLLVPVLCLAFAIVPGLRAEIYQYVDKDGVVVITDKKPGPRAKKVTTFKTPQTEIGKSGEQEPPKDDKTAKPENAPGQSMADQEARKTAESQQKRNEEASRLEAEARKPEQFSREKQIEQREKLERARNLRKGVDEPSAAAGR